MDIGVIINLLIFGGGAVIAVLSWFLWDKRYSKAGKEDGLTGYHKTEEVFIDPIAGKKLRVHYNPETGERYYKDEN